MKSTLIVALLALAVSTLANPTPYRGGPSGLPPPNPRATIRYANNGGTVHLAVDGDYLAVTKECRGLEGTLPLEFVNVETMYPSGDRRAYSLLLFHEWGCKVADKDPVIVSYFDGQGTHLFKDAQGNVVIPKSFKFIP
ncbi:hypothetical protein BCR44DRAFT_126143 [Catenaria anguillulae PL171]|uniref:Uncharacterized protein n=1 Tax=Catenaria anguillulae PL171 TaxID=765915 RepID=A0A1Y2HMQ2_9FUNG|nr:hypothetical protein BCR44DRAFT_126143 [Catenaria anguillulae PL171]